METVKRNKLKINLKEKKGNKDKKIELKREKCSENKKIANNENSEP